MADVSTFATIVLMTYPGNFNPTIHNKVEVRILGGTGVCEFKPEETNSCVDHIDYVAEVLVDEKVVAKIPASVVPKEVIPLLYDQLESSTMVSKKSLDELAAKIRGMCTTIDCDGAPGIFPVGPKEKEKK